MKTSYDERLELLQMKNITPLENAPFWTTLKHVIAFIGTRTMRI